MTFMKKNIFLFYLYGFIIFCFVLIINGIIPFYSIPARDQAIWALGFAKSLSHGPIYSVFSTDFGYPIPAAISFGLPAVINMSWLLRFSFEPKLAYDLVFSAWFLISFIGGFQFCKYYGLKGINAFLCAALWLITPVVVNHASYGMLSLGMALLPSYFYCCVLFSREIKRKSLDVMLTHSLYAFAAIISIFMDGYTFVIFAVMSSCFLLFNAAKGKCENISRTAWFFFYHFFVFSIAYLLYSAFIGKSSYTFSDMDFFRGWGVDLSYLFIPTMHTHWLFDTLHFYLPRSTKNHYGDDSVWITSFILPLILIMPVAIYWGVKKKLDSNWLLCFFLFSVGMYLALGPSFKLFSLKPIGCGSCLPLMPASAAWFATGSAFIYQHVPGINVMRATYRWIALSFMMSWWMLILVLSTVFSKKIKLCILVFMLIAYMPALPSKLASGNNQYKAFDNINDYLIQPLREDLHGAKTIAFIPWGNDFFANYLAPMLGKRTYNIGGDKNLEAAWPHWPINMRPLANKIDKNNAGYIVKMLSTGEADAIIIPYFDMIWRAGTIKNDAGELVNLTTKGKATKWISNIHRAEFLPVVMALQKEKYLDIKDNLLYAVVRLNNKGIAYPVNYALNDYKNFRLTGQGWYLAEPDHVWSYPEATLNLPIDADKGSKHTARIHFSVFGATPSKPKSVIFTSSAAPGFEKTLISKGGEEIFDYEFTQGATISQLHLKVQGAISPKDLNLPDDRVLGIYLTKVEMFDN
ncbi:hypothetical protein ABU178_12500 [Pantoea osteomyelitidis]|uniref:Uncharacterized protein n=1 Tax=Pantoea osteomyelitidis TaxID=3230026 RepID=A0ABW7PXD3_9GAMM